MKENYYLRRYSSAFTPSSWNGKYILSWKVARRSFSESFHFSWFTDNSFFIMSVIELPNSETWFAFSDILQETACILKILPFLFLIGRYNINFWRCVCILCEIHSQFAEQHYWQDINLWKHLPKVISRHFHNNLKFSHS